MPRSASFLITLDVCFLLALAGCGASTMANSGRVMQSLMVTPSSADAQNFPGAKVQFTATATFNMPPTTLKSPAVVWSIGSPFPTPPPMMGMSTPMSSSPTVDTNGVAQCNGFTGIVAVQATAPADPNVPVSQMNAMMGTVAGVAQLTCP
jgi:hypothetical protein